MDKHESFEEFQDPGAPSVNRLVVALDRAYHRPGLLMWRAFLQGIMYAFGATIGFTILLTIALYVLQAFGGINLLNPITDKLQNMILNIDNKATQQTTLSPAQQNALEKLLATTPTPSPTK